MKKIQATLRMERAHADGLMKALDVTSRVMTGQWEELMSLVPHSTTDPHDEPRRLIRGHINAIKDLLGHSPNGSYGIHNPEIPDRARVMYDLFRVIRNSIAWVDHPEGGIQVCFDKLDDPVSTETPLAICEVSDTEKMIDGMKVRNRNGKRHLMHAYLVHYEGMSETKVVEAANFGDAVKLWRDSMREQWGDDWEPTDEPDSVEHICEGPIVRGVSMQDPIVKDLMVARETIGLLSSMVDGREAHSEDSRRAVRRGMGRGDA